MGVIHIKGKQMLHDNRNWIVRRHDLEGTLEEQIKVLAEALTKWCWSVGNGWQIGSYLLLNDSTSEDGAFELAVFKLEDDDNYRQIESVTYGWMKMDEAEKSLTAMMNGEQDDGINIDRAPRYRVIECNWDEQTEELWKAAIQNVKES